MSNWKAEALLKYSGECLKQTMPYQYELSLKDAGEEMNEGLVSSSASATVVYFPNKEEDILDFEKITSKYVVFISNKGMADKDIVADMIDNADGADIIYGDEDFMNDNVETVTGNEGDSIPIFRTPWRKPDYSPDTLMSFPYIETNFAIRVEFAKELELKKKDSGLSDEERIYDLLLRAMEKTDKIVHIRKVMFHRFLSDLLRDEESKEEETKEVPEAPIKKREPDIKEITLEDISSEDKTDETEKEIQEETVEEEPVKEEPTVEEPVIEESTTAETAEQTIEEQNEAADDFDIELPELDESIRHDFLLSDEDIYKALMKKYSQEGYETCRSEAKSRLGFDILPKAEKNGYQVSIIIPSKDNPDLLIRCIESIQKAAGKVSYEIIVIDNGSMEINARRVYDLSKSLPKGLMKYDYGVYDFNYSIMCNRGAHFSKGAYLLFMNDDMEVICDNFLEKLLGYASLPHVAAVGAKLLYPEDRSIQHVGISNINKGPSHKLATFSDEGIYYFGRNRYVWDVLAVTGACLMLDKEKFYRAGGFSDRLQVGYNDVDLCVKLYELGYYNVVNNEVTLLHYESYSRGYDNYNDYAAQRLKEERAMFYEGHRWLLTNPDPFYHPNLDKDTIDYRVDTVSEYEVTDFRNPYTTYKSLPAKPSDKIMFTMEHVGYERAISPEVEDAYTFEGWCFVKKADNALINRYLILCPLNQNGKLTKNHLEIQMSPKYRTDVREVFPDAVNVELAGFVCRIPVSALDMNTKYRLGVCARTIGGFGRYKLTLGDTYEPGRGIVTDQ